MCDYQYVFSLAGSWRNKHVDVVSRWVPSCRAQAIWGVPAAADLAVGERLFRVVTGPGVATVAAAVQAARAGLTFGPPAPAPAAHAADVHVLYNVKWYADRSSEPVYNNDHLGATWIAVWYPGRRPGCAAYSLLSTEHFVRPRFLAYTPVPPAVLDDPDLPFLTMLDVGRI